MEARKALDQYRKRLEGVKTSKGNDRQSLQKRAARGNSTAQDELASLYHLEKADHRAVKWFRRAAEQGYYGNVVTPPTRLVSAEEAGAVLGYMDGAEWFKSFDKIDKRTWKKLSARANAWLSRMEFGESIPEDWHLYEPDAVSFDDIKEAAEGGECCAQVAMARMCETGTHVSKNVSEAVDWYQQALKAGEPEDNGLEEAFSALCLLASTGKRKAQEAIVELCSEGTIEPRDEAERTQWNLWNQQSEARTERSWKRLERKKKAEQQKQDELEKRAAAGDREAQFEVYSAVELLERDAHDGDCEAQFKLGVYRDDPASLESAAGQGHAAACSYLGEMYLRGKLIEQDLAEAIRWFEKGAERGDVFSQHYLAELFAEGRGVTQDDVKSLMWYRIASAQDDFLERYEKIAEQYRWVSPNAVTAGRREIEARVTKAQQQEARELAHDWLKTKAKR